MARKIPPEEAFDFYRSLGAGRSYQQVARRFSVAKRSVQKLADRDNWQKRIEEIEARARQAADEKAANSLAGVAEKHLKIVRALEAKALASLREMPIRSAGEAARILDAALRNERSLLGLDAVAATENRSAELDARKKKLCAGRARWEADIISRCSEHTLELADRFLKWYEKKFFVDHPGATKEEYAEKNREREFMLAVACEFWRPVEQGRRSVA